MIASPLKYQGNKLKLMPSILELLPKKMTGFVDVFGGSGVVAANVAHARKCPVIYNEMDKIISGIIMMLTRMPKLAFEQEVWRTLRDYRITDARCEEGYLKMVASANADVDNPNLLLLWVISRHAHSNLLRMNLKGEVNIQFGDRAISHRLGEVYAEADAFRNAMKNVKIEALNYTELLTKIAPDVRKNDVLYFDPPYFASGQFVYRCKWGIVEERRLLKNLTRCHELGFKFMLSNCTRHGPHLNMFLVKWMRDFNVHKIDSSYCLSNAYEDKSNTKEVIVTNY